MTMQAVQLVIIDLENGSRGVFIGTPITSDSLRDEECTVDQVWFTNIQMIPKGATLEQVVELAIAQMEAPKATMQ